MKKFKFIIALTMVLVLTLFLILFLTGKSDKNQETTPDSEEKDTWEFTAGIDVSEYQGDIDWIAVKDSGVEFAMIRLGYRGYGEEGNFQKDKNFDKNMAEAISAGVDVGVYIFSQALNAQEAMEEADFIIENISSYYVEYPLVIDVEYVEGEEARANNLTADERTDVIRAFCKRIQQSGYSPGIYSSGNWFSTGMDLGKLSEYFIWLQDYTGEFSNSIEFDMLQYSNTGNINGINGNVDLNKFFDN